ncbi:MAG: T9SS type A sorting domain-containing protein [Chitinophagaceae bacterium]|nr:T9SS type A sorting domain-containing protein [Chitinophagaceae bacterium]
MTPPVSFPQNPMQTNNTFSLNRFSQTAKYIPAGVGGPNIIVYKVDEYRNNVWIGSVLRETEQVILDCTSLSPPPTLHIDTNSIIGGKWQNNRVEVCIGQPIQLCFDIKTSDNNAKLELSDNPVQLLPGMTITYYNQNSDSVRGCLIWTPGLNKTGEQNALISIINRDCNTTNIMMDFGLPINFYIVPAINISNDTTICMGETATLFASGGFNNYNWSVVSGSSLSLSCTNCPNPTATPTVGTTYAVTSAGNICPTNNNYKGTVRVNIYPDPIQTPQISIAVSPTGKVWEGLLVTFTATPTACKIPAYQWQLNGNDITGANSATWGSTTLKNNDVVSCKIICGDYCARPQTQISNDINMNVSVSVANTKKEEGIVTMYPNPNTGSFTISVSSTNSTVSNIEVMDIMGKVVYSEDITKSSKTHDISIPNIPTGVYSVKISVDDLTEIKRLVISK